MLQVLNLERATTETAMMRHEMERARRHALAAADVLDRSDGGNSGASVGALMADMVTRHVAGAFLFSGGAAGRKREGAPVALWARSDELSAGFGREAGESVGWFAARPGVRDCAVVSWGDLRGDRAMATTPGAKGGFLSGLDTLPAVDPLWQDSVIGATGVQVLEGLSHSVSIPRGTAGVSVSIQSGEGATTSPVDPALGEVSMTPRAAMATVKCSLQLARQAPSVQDFLARLLVRSLRAKFDSLLMQGAGGAEPQGLANLPTSTGIQQVSGTSLAWAGILDAQRLASASGVPDSAMAWVGAPTVRATIGARERTSGSGRMLWDDGRIAGQPAIATPDAPASTLFVGGFSTAVLALFGPLEIRLDTSGGFDTGSVSWQVFSLFDIAFPQPSAFVRIASIS